MDVKMDVMILMGMDGMDQGAGSAVFEGGSGLLSLFAGDSDRGLKVVEAEHLAELHLTHGGLAVLISSHGDGWHTGTSEPDEVVKVDLEFSLQLSALHGDGLVAQDLGMAFGGVGSGCRVLLDAQGTPRLLGGLGLEHQKIIGWLGSVQHAHFSQPTTIITITNHLIHSIHAEIYQSFIFLILPCS